MKKFKYTRKEIVKMACDKDYLWGDLGEDLLATISKEEQSQRLMMEQVDKDNNQWAELMDRNGRPGWFVWIESGTLRCLKGSRNDYLKMEKQENKTWIEKTGIKSPNTGMETMIIHNAVKIDKQDKPVDCDCNNKSNKDCDMKNVVCGKEDKHSMEIGEYGRIYCSECDKQDKPKKEKCFVEEGKKKWFKKYKTLQGIGSIECFCPKCNAIHYPILSPLIEDTNKTSLVPEKIENWESADEDDPVMSFQSGNDCVIKINSIIDYLTLISLQKE